MIARYTTPEMGASGATSRRYETWLEVETRRRRGDGRRRRRARAEAARDIRAKGDFDVARIDEIEQTTQHDVIAFTTAVAEHVGPARAGCTSA